MSVCLSRRILEKAPFSPAVEGFYAEINGIKQILVSLEAEIFADQHIQNPLKSASGKSC